MMVTSKAEFLGATPIIERIEKQLQNGEEPGELLEFEFWLLPPLEVQNAVSSIYESAGWAVRWELNVKDGRCKVVLS